MHWILQSDLYREPGMDELARVLDRAGVPFSQHRLVPGAGGLDPDVDPAGKVIAFGSYAMRHVARRKGWMPGCFELGESPLRACFAHWAASMLNADAVFSPFSAARPTIDPFFIRPVADSKSFTGTVMSRRKLAEWQSEVATLGDDAGSRLRGDSEILWCAPKTVQREYRLWIVRGAVVTASQYRIGNRVAYDSAVDADAIGFGEQVAALWTPAQAFVLDVGLHDGRWKVVEINMINSAGLYAANVGKLVDALESAFG